jgi:Protein of unknown function (DUF4031)
MVIYVDAPIYARAGVKNPRTLYAHMIADALPELHEFAEKLGIRKHFFHRSKAAHHYDINGTQWEKAIIAGAKQVSSKELLKIAKENSK